MAMISTSSIGHPNFTNKSDAALKSLNDTFRQLSSGLKTGHGFENAALLAIADRFTNQLQGAHQARLQVNDGISLTQVADAALAEVESGFQQLQSLAIQSADGSLVDADRQVLQEQASAIQSQIQSIITDTDYNDINVLASNETLTFQSGANATGQTQIQLQDLTTAFSQIDISSQSGAEVAISSAADALARVSTQRTNFDNVQLNLVSVSDTLSRLSETLTSADGRIADADMAQEISSAISLAIRAQAGVALQAQGDRLSGSRVQQLLQ
ncbi:MAG: hypothetical protein HQL07_05730 [Nitrospirae bacterium]|nr:hypothetical protein [Magnetococcales bacterium]